MSNIDNSKHRTMMHKYYYLIFSLVLTFLIQEKSLKADFIRGIYLSGGYERNNLGLSFGNNENRFSFKKKDNKLHINYDNKSINHFKNEKTFYGIELTESKINDWVYFSKLLMIGSFKEDLIFDKSSENYSEFKDSIFNDEEKTFVNSKDYWKINANADGMFISLNWGYGFKYPLTQRQNLFNFKGGVGFGYHRTSFNLKLSRFNQNETNNSQLEERDFDNVKMEVYGWSVSSSGSIYQFVSKSLMINIGEYEHVFISSNSNTINSRRNLDYSPYSFRNRRNNLFKLVYIL